MALNTQSIPDKAKVDETKKDYIIITDERGYKAVKKIRDKPDLKVQTIPEDEELKPQPIKKYNKKVKQ